MKRSRSKLESKPPDDGGWMRKPEHARELEQLSGAKAMILLFRAGHNTLLIGAARRDPKKWHLLRIEGCRKIQAPTEWQIEQLKASFAPDTIIFTDHDGAIMIECYAAGLLTEEEAHQYAGEDPSILGHLDRLSAMTK